MEVFLILVSSCVPVSSFLLSGSLCAAVTLFWFLLIQIPKGTVTEISAADKAEELRR